MNKSVWVIIQAFLGTALALWLLRIAEGGRFYFVMWRGGGTVVAFVVFLGILCYHLGQQYLANNPSQYKK